MSVERETSSLGRKGSFARFILLTGIIIGCFGVSGYLVLERFSGLEQQMEALRDRVEELGQRVERSVQKSEEALERAARAEANALEAAQGRARAEIAQEEAQKLGRQAQEEAERARQEAEEARRQAEEIRKQREAELNRLQAALSRMVETRRTALGLVMTLGDDSIQFDFDKAVLRAENRELLGRIAGVLLTHDGYRIQVYGHTDDIGTEEYNQELSERRAQAVRDYLVEAGIGPDIITVKGFGKSNPLVAGRAPQARAKNRRVEIGIVDTVISYEGTTSRAER